MMIGYGRTSTIEQVAGLEAQIRDLKAAGAEKLFRENVSSVAPCKQLEAAIEFAREGNTLVVTKIDRLARSVRHLCEIVDRLQAKGVALRTLNMNLDTNDAPGKLMLQIIGSIAEFERSIMLARQLEGIAKAKAEGKYRGGIPMPKFAGLIVNMPRPVSGGRRQRHAQGRITAKAGFSLPGTPCFARLPARAGKGASNLPRRVIDGELSATSRASRCGGN